MRNIKAVIPLLTLMTALFSENARALCEYTTQGRATEFNLNFGNIIVQRDTPVGTELASRSGQTPSYAFRCTTSHDSVGSLTLFTTLSSYGNNVYNTNIDGVGIMVEYRFQTSVYPFPYLGKSGPMSGATGIQRATVKLIKTKSGAVGSGPLRTGRIARFIWDNLAIYNVNLTGVSTITPVACSVTQTAISVPMGDVLRSEFTGVGSVATSKAFSIPLNCDENTRVKITLDATADSSGIPGVIALNPSTSDKVASGVGVQVLRNSTPVTLGSALQVGTVATAGVYTIPLAARYYQTQARVTAGQANATATFTMTYN